jgi:hypothetical protein
MVIVITLNIKKSKETGTLNLRFNNKWDVP